MAVKFQLKKTKKVDSLGILIESLNEINGITLKFENARLTKDRYQKIEILHILTLLFVLIQTALFFYCVKPKN